MNTYEIKVNNTENENELKTFKVTAEDIETLTEVIKNSANYADETSFLIDDGEYIVITQNSEHGYNADAYASLEAYEKGDDSIGGGLCTGNLSDAIEMAITSR